MEHNGEIEQEGSPREGRDDDHRSVEGSLEKKNVLDIEAADISGHGHNKNTDWETIAKLAFQCIGVVFGDLGTSPLYVLPGIFPSGIQHRDDLIGVMSLINYSIILIGLIKYVFIVLAANDDGHGGTFALYSLLCRYAKIGFIPNHQKEDREVSNYMLDTPNRRTKRASAVKSMLENSSFMKYLLLFMTMLGVSMLLGDGILTPCISVLSAIGGVKDVAGPISDTTMAWIGTAILIVLFQIQRFGTDKVGYLFAPIIFLWFVFIALIGFYNFVKYDPAIIKALNPWYIVTYFKRNGKDAWISLGGVILCLTGSEALFADLGHFNIRSIQMSSCGVMFPAILLAYYGQCSYLRKHPDEVADAFFRSIPKRLYWPQFILAILAAIIASQSIISASFSIVQQAVALGCFPRVKVAHTSEKYEGQVYVPEINTLLMIACAGVTLGFKNTLRIGNAYGIAVAFVFVLTSVFLLLVMVMIWKTHIIFIIIYVLTIGIIELAFLTAALAKFVDGGYIPFCFAIFVVAMMVTWNYGYSKKYFFEMENSVPLDKLSSIASNPGIQRLHGIGLFYSPIVYGISPIFTHYLSAVPALHSVIVFVSIKCLPISKVLPEERFLFQRVKSNEMMFRCVVRYGYKDLATAQEHFEGLLVNKLKEYIEEEKGENGRQDLSLIDDARHNNGVVYLLGEGKLMAAKDSSLTNKIMVDYVYHWLSSCARQANEVFLIPQRCLLKVGMSYEVK